MNRRWHCPFQINRVLRIDQKENLKSMGIPKRKRIGSKMDRGGIDNVSNDPLEMRKT